MIKARDTQRAQKREERENQRREALSLCATRILDYGEAGRLTAGQIAARVGVCEKTVSRWRGSPAFREAEDRAREERCEKYLSQAIKQGQAFPKVDYGPLYEKLMGAQMSEIRHVHEGDTPPKWGISDICAAPAERNETGSSYVTCPKCGVIMGQIEADGQILIDRRGFKWRGFLSEFYCGNCTAWFRVGKEKV